jgi:ubiquinone/menaquinone biosynthesis C-methylase UbiE/uncharacterized protein YbaR (Trm112 family)
MIAQNFLDILRCPLCSNGSTVLEQTENFLTCKNEHRFPVVSGVPRLLLGKESISSRAAFTEQWEYREAGKFENPSRIFWLKVDDTLHYLLSDLKFNPEPGDWILDAGCGSGEKSMALAKKFPFVQVVAMDFSDTIGALAKKAQGIQNLHFVQGDVLAPPFAHGAFKEIISLGVVHHTPNPKRAFLALARLIRTHGSFLIWVYPDFKSSPLYQKFYYVFRDVFFLGRGHLLPAWMRLWAVRLLCLPLIFLKPLLPLSKKFNPSLYENLSFADFYQGLVFLMFDNLSPPFQSRHTDGEVRAWFQSNGFSNTVQPEMGLYRGTKIQSGSV